MVLPRAKCQWGWESSNVSPYQTQSSWGPCSFLMLAHIHMGRGGKRERGRKGFWKVGGEGKREREEVREKKRGRGKEGGTDE